jgi:hypothetical protein
VAFDPTKLGKGNHKLQVVVDPENRVTLPNRSNTTFTENKLVCK